MAAERLTEQAFGLGRQVSERKILGRALDLGEIGGQLDAQRRVALHLELEEYRLGARIAAEHDSDLLGLAAAQIVEFGDGDRSQMSQGAALRTGQGDSLVFDVQLVLRRDVDTHEVQPVNGL